MEQNEIKIKQMTSSRIYSDYIHVVVLSEDGEKSLQCSFRVSD